jgi:hypothetical protein
MALRLSSVHGWKRGILSKKIRSREHAIFLPNMKKEQKVP